MPIDPEETGSQSIAGLNISNMFLNQTSLTSVDISIYTNEMTLVPTSIKAYYTEIDPLTGSVIGSPSSLQTFTYTANVTSIFTFSITGLTSGKKYMFYVQAYKNSDYGIQIAKYIQLSSTFSAAKVTTVSPDPSSSSKQKAFLVLTAPQEKNKINIVTRQFNAIEVPSPSGFSSQGVSFPETYYTFGTSMFFEPNQDKPNQEAAVGFFGNLEGTSGYFIFLQSTALAASRNQKTIRIVKVNGSEIYPLKSSQISSSKMLEGLYGGVLYNVDIKLKLSGSRIDITVYVNGYKISVFDQNSSNPSGRILNPTNKMALLASKGKVSFDYVYGSKIEKAEYENFEVTGNFYQGQFSNDFLSTAFGDAVYENVAGQDLYTSRQNMVDEFGTTVREIAKRSIKFNSRPAFPIRWTTGTNRFAKIISSKYSNFGAESYVLNNTSTTIPLSDNNSASFYIYGNTLSSSGQLEYVTDMEDTTYNTREPVVFQSKWIQTENDAKTLGQWIKNNVVNKGKVVSMEVFGNPMIAVGDMISITYPYNGFNGGERLIVTNVTQSFDEGLTTNITCRLI